MGSIVDEPAGTGHWDARDHVHDFADAYRVGREDPVARAGGQDPPHGAGVRRQRQCIAPGMTTGVPISRFMRKHRLDTDSPAA